ncbi:E2F4 isoform 3, partial [Pan troglodytes]
MAGPAAEITVSGGPGTDSKDSGELSSLPLGPTTLDTWPLQSSALLDSSSSSSSNSNSSSSSGPNPSTSFEPIKADPTGVLELPKELSEIFDPTRECMSSELLEELMSSEGTCTVWLGPRLSDLGVAWGPLPPDPYRA